MDAEYHPHTNDWRWDHRYWAYRLWKTDGVYGAEAWPLTDPSRKIVLRAPVSDAHEAEQRIRRMIDKALVD